MKNYVRLISPAKINLVLAVGASREDGFHEVHTIMHSLALHDSLTMRRFEEDGEGLGFEHEGLSIVLKCETSGDIDSLEVAPEENIAYRAIKELAQELGRTENETIHISLSKVIPAEAGLGGGSSNAAAALLGAATLWGIDLQDDRLYAVASRLGADVAFFLKGGCAYLSGRGEVFENSLKPRKGLLPWCDQTQEYQQQRPMQLSMLILAIPIEPILRVFLAKQMLQKLSYGTI